MRFAEFLKAKEIKEKVSDLLLTAAFIFQDSEHRNVQDFKIRMGRNATVLHDVQNLTAVLGASTIINTIIPLAPTVSEDRGNLNP